MLYAIIFGWPEAKITLKDIKPPVGAKIEMLGIPGALNWTMNGDNLIIDPPACGKEGAPCVEAFSIKIPLK